MATKVGFIEAPLILLGNWLVAMVSFYQNTDFLQ
jgi:hypothetical protein